MHNRLIALPLIVASTFAFAGCGTDEGGRSVEAEGLDLSRSMNLVTFYGEDEVAFLNFAYDPERSFHFSMASEYPPVGDPSGLTGQQPVALEDLVTGGEGGSSAGRFSGRAVRVSGFDGAVAAAAFSGRSPGAGGFNGSAVEVPGFSGSLSTGRVGGCSLRGLCEFIGIICELDTSAEGAASCRAAVNECSAVIDTAPIPVELTPLICAFADYIDCLVLEIRARGLAGLEAADPELICRAEALALVQAGIELDF